MSIMTSIQRLSALRSLLVALALGFFCTPVFAAGAPDTVRQKELLHLLKQDCGSCHGLTLQGGLGPPLSPGALAGKPATVLSRIVLDGVPGTPMPPWRALLTEAEVDWLIQTLIQGRYETR